MGTAPLLARIGMGDHELVNHRGLQRYGYDDLAVTIRQDTLHLIEDAGFREYYDPRDGSGCGLTDFSWSAALALELSMNSRSGKSRDWQKELD